MTFFFSIPDFPEGNSGYSITEKEGKREEERREERREKRIDEPPKDLKISCSLKKPLAKNINLAKNLISLIPLVW